MSSKSESSSTASGGIGVMGLLGVAFVVLKLMGFINWSWWWVTAPFWAGFALFAIGALVVMICGGLTLLFVWFTERR